MEEALITLIIVCSCISIIGSLALIIIYSFSQKINTLGTQFVLAQAVSDLLLSGAMLSNVIFFKLDFPETTLHNGEPKTSWSCNFSAFLVQFSSQATTAWHFMIGIAITQTVYSATKYKVHSYSFIVYHGYVWVVSFLIAGVLYLCHEYGPQATGCWIKTPKYHLLSVVPITGYYIGTTIVLIVVVKRVATVTARLSKSSREEERQFMVQVIKYIGVFLIMWAVPLVVSIYSIFSSHISFSVQSIVVACICLQGFANSIVWLTSPRFIKMYKEYRKKQRQKKGYQTLTGTDDSSDITNYQSTNNKKNNKNNNKNSNDNNNNNNNYNNTDSDSSVIQT